MASILIFLTCSLIFFATFALYHLPIEAVSYPCILCAVVLLFFYVISHTRQKRKMKHLASLKELPPNLLEQLEQYVTPQDHSYRDIITAMAIARAKQQQGDAQRYSDMMFYYSTWAHQIKTPIASMRLLLQGEDTDFSRNVGDDLQRIEQYVDMVLTYLRLDSEYTDFVFKEISLDDVIKTAIRHNARSFIKKGLSLNYENLNKTLVTDEKWLLFVIEQILSNALKYTVTGSISIFLSDPDTLCIQDTGVGIEKSDIPRIFENGFTGFNGRINTKASGIGLYLCRRICTALGMTITADSEPGKGTSIYITLNVTKM